VTDVTGNRQGSTVRRRLAAELRKLCEDAGKTREQVAEFVGCGGS
jgi:hypothetical protein